MLVFRLIVGKGGYVLAITHSTRRWLGEDTREVVILRAGNGEPSLTGFHQVFDDRKSMSTMSFSVRVQREYSSCVCN